MVNVLIVDDDPAICRLLKLVLATENIHAEGAQSGEAAIQRLQDGRDQPDLILLDLAMPGMDGREVFRQARLTGITCPIVFCSSYGAEAANRELGGQGAIDKPFDPGAVVASIEALTASGRS